MSGSRSSGAATLRMRRRRRRVLGSGRGTPPRPSEAAASRPAPAPASASGSRFGSRWVWISLALHAALLGTWLAARRGPPPEPRPIPVSLMSVDAAERDPEEPDEPERPLAFHRTASVPVRERVELPEESLAVVPPPRDVPLEAAGSPGGFAAEAGSAPAALQGVTLSGEGGGTAGSGFGRGNALAGDGSFQAYVAGLREVGLDVVFVIDATGSMGWVIAEVRDRILDLAATIRRLVPLTRLGVVAYRDAGGPEFVTRHEPLTLAAARVRRFLAALDARGGGDQPEAVAEGLRVAVDEMPWRDGARRMIIILGDAPPHGQGEAERLAARFRDAGGRVAAVDVGFDANPHIVASRMGRPVEELTTLHIRGPLAELRAVARAGGGEGTNLENQRSVVRQLAVLILGREWADEMRSLLADL